jgi:4-hydroxybenzoate polyprenyltransferase
VLFGVALGLHWDDPRLAAIGVTVLMTQLSISTLNDWADRTRDAAAGRPKPLVIGHLPPAVALGLAILFALGALPAALFFGSPAGLVLLVGFAAGWAYDLWLKPTALSFLPFAIAFPLLPTWVGIVAGRHFTDFFALIAGGAFLAVAVHLADSLPDLRSDAAIGVHSLAVTLGFDKSVGAIIACLLIGSTVVIAANGSRPLAATVVSLAGLLASALVLRFSARAPSSARWVAAAFAVIASVVLISRLAYA